MWLYTNNAVGTLAAGIGPTATQLQLSPGQFTLFPMLASGTDSFFVTLTDVATKSLFEIVEVTATATNVFTITRGQGGTTPRTWLAGDIVSLRATAEEYADYLSKTFGGTVAGPVIFNNTVTTNAILTANADINCATLITAVNGFNVSSDYRLKEYIGDEPYALERVRHLRPVTYTLKTNGERRHGFLAHELAAVIPSAVRGEKDGADLQSVDYNQLISVLVCAIQDLDAEVRLLRDAVATENK